jgi:hypothetical protein
VYKYVVVVVVVFLNYTNKKLFCNFKACGGIIIANIFLFYKMLNLNCQLSNRNRNLVSVLRCKLIFR